LIRGADEREAGGNPDGYSLRAMRRPIQTLSGDGLIRRRDGSLITGYIQLEPSKPCPPLGRFRLVRCAIRDGARVGI